ncbi:MAG: glycosyltransferase family A protein, partial [Bacteroidota bacterium]
MSKVSVIIPNYNNAKWLPKCLDSALAQDQLLEIITVDDHSEDNSFSVLESYQSKYPDLLKVYCNPNKGANSARDYGYSKSSGEYIQWLDSDDELLPGKFKSQLEKLKSTGADIVYSDWRIDFWDGDTKISSEQKEYGDYDDFLLELIKDNWTSPNNYLLQRSIADKLDKGVGWNADTRVGQDREYFTTAGLIGATFTYQPGMFAVYNKQSSGSISAIDFGVRLKLNQVLEARFRDLIINHKELTRAKKSKYLKVLNTHKVKACFYNKKISFDSVILPWKVDWEIMHWKMKV